MMTDPIADMLTRIRNGLHRKHEAVDIPASKMKLEIARILKTEGYIENFKIIQDDKQGVLRVFLKYDGENRPVIIELKKISKPGRRVYAGVDDIPVVKNGLGLAIISTSKGVISDKTAKTEKVGGEVICTVW
jgi:small subunit ribosomal protein S8